MKIEMTIQFDPETQAVSLSVPSDNVLALGLCGMLQAYINNRIQWGEPKSNSGIIPFRGTLPPIGPQ